MGKSGSSGGGGSTQVVTPPRPSIPNEELIQSSALWRLHASSPYYSSPWRTMDFAQNYYAPSMQLPTFTQYGAPQPWGLVNNTPSGFTGAAVPSGGASPQGAWNKGQPNANPKGQVNSGVGMAPPAPPASPAPVQDKTLVRPDLNMEVPQR